MARKTSAEKKIAVNVIGRRTNISDPGWSCGIGEPLRARARRLRFLRPRKPQKGWNGVRGGPGILCERFVKHSDLRIVYRAYHPPKRNWPVAGIFSRLISIELDHLPEMVLKVYDVISHEIIERGGLLAGNRLPGEYVQVVAYTLLPPLILGRRVHHPRDLQIEQDA